MINVLICGIFSKTGMMLYKMLRDNAGINVVCGVDSLDTLDADCDVPVYKSFDEVKEVVEAVMDFSSPDRIEEVLSFVTENKCVLIEGTVGYTKAQKELIRSYGDKAPIFMSNNLSLGVNLTFRLCAQAAKTLGNYDVEIVETYYRDKVNAPGATTLTLAQYINEALGGDRKIVVGRTSKRKGNEICIHSVRGGNVVGDQEIMFIGEKEVLTIKHQTLNSTIYCEGAIEILNFMKDKPNGFYDLKDYYGF